MRFLWLCILLITGLAQGETIPSIEKPGRAISNWFLISWDGTGAETAQAACALAQGNWVQYSEVLNHGDCLNGYNNRIWMQGGMKCEDGLFAMPTWICSPSYTCPDPSWTLSPDKRSCSRTCPVAPLTPITAPIALQFERKENPVIEDKLTDSMKTKLACLRKEVAAAKGILTVNSAWRPPAYQDHFYEIKTKYNLLDTKEIPGCSAIKMAIAAEYQNHGLTGLVGKTSKHSIGEAFDANWSSGIEIDLLAGKCNLYRPWKKKDRMHFIAK